MSREQRRANRKQQARAGAPAVSRRTPVKAPGSSGPPWVVIGVFGGLLAVVVLIVYLIVQAASGDEGLKAWEKAEQDASPELPGVFHPTQGRQHFNYTYSPDREPRAFCDGVESSGGAAASTTPSGSVTATAAPTRTPTATPTAAATTSGTPGSTTPQATATVPTNCYATNPPSSGQHLPQQRNVDLGNGARINIPADPDVYPEDIIVPREAIPHILEHAGVYVGYNCAAGDSACADVVEQLTDLVNDRIDNHNDRVVMARNPDLPVGTIGVASWTRVLNMRAEDYDEGAISDFIGTHSCRFDPEGFCG
jgi:uncharacterized protein DUF3105